jgi:GNAT superfamily N-acetyltransferase
METIKITTYSGLQFDFRHAGSDDGPLLAEFWRNVSRENLPARFLGENDPTLFDQPGSPGDRKAGPTSTFLAIGGDGAVVSIAILVSDRDPAEARVMVFTRDGVTSHGVSWALLERVLAEAKTRGFKAVTSVFDVKDVPAIRLELKMGFVDRHYPDNENLKLLRWVFE